jgi:hypothetical protein
MGNSAAKRARLSIDITDLGIKRLVKVAAAKRDMAIKDYCLEAITRQLRRDGELPGDEEQIRRAKALAERMDQRRVEIGAIGLSVTDLIKEGRRR